MEWRQRRSSGDLSDEALLTHPRYRWRVAKSEAANQDDLAGTLKNVPGIAPDPAERTTCSVGAKSL
jgi:hypothetical protein